MCYYLNKFNFLSIHGSGKRNIAEYTKLIYNSYMSKITFFVDTNFFFQCRDIKEINWSNVTSDDIVELFISRPVQIEIDKFKNVGNTRKAQKARKISSLFREILNSENQCVTHNVNKKIINIRFSQNYTSHELEIQNVKLDLSRPDDEIIATIFKYNSDNTPQAYLLTHDTNPLLTAKQSGIQAKSVPDSWLLPPENDQRDKEIIMLKNKISELTIKEPKANCSFTFNDISGDKFINQNEISIVVCDSITYDDWKKIENSIKKIFPLKINFTDKCLGPLDLNRLGFKHIYHSPSKEVIDKYITKSYPEWLKKVRKYFEKFIESKNTNKSIIHFKLTLNNNGSLPIENLIFTLNLYGGAKFYPPNLEFKDDYFNHSNFPLPPIPPKGYWETVNNPFTTIANALTSKFELKTINSYDDLSSVLPLSKTEHDRYGFYWSEGEPKELLSEWTFTCDEFRHKYKPEIFSYFIKVPDDIKIESCTFKITISGSNIIKPIESIKKLNFTYVNLSIFDRIDDILEKIKNIRRNK